MITFNRVKAGLYNINLGDQRIGIINRYGKQWLTDIPMANHWGDVSNTLEFAKWYTERLMLAFLGE